MFAEEGLLDARIAEIAKRAGVSYGSFYHYFDSKDVLFREIAADVDARLRAPVEEIILPRSDLSPQERLRKAIQRHYETYRAEARLLGVIEQAARLDDQLAATRAEWQHEDSLKVAESIRLLQRRGLADPNLDADRRGRSARCHDAPICRAVARAPGVRRRLRDRRRHGHAACSSTPSVSRPSRPWGRSSADPVVPPPGVSFRDWQGRGGSHAHGRHDPCEHRRPHDRAARHVQEPRPRQVAR